MRGCNVLSWNPGSLHPAPLDRKSPGDTIRVEHDVQEDLDCNDAGITIVSSLWAIHPNDVDGDLTLSGDTFTGLVTSVLVSGGEDGRYYRLVNTITTSDNQVVERTSSIPVIETRSRTA